MPLNSRGFRDALGHFATGVAIVTARAADGQTWGLTINSFASVSLEPALVLWSLDRGSDRFGLFMGCDQFGVNLLGAQDQELSYRLSRKGEGLLDGAQLFSGEHRVPLLNSAIAKFECHAHQRHDGGDHVIIVGRVLSFEHASHADPLLYYRGKYRGLSHA